MHEWRASAQEIHGRDLLAVARGHTAWFLEASAPALVLGSTQPAVAGGGVDVVRRRSGGGAVLVGDGACTWLDLVIPRTSPLWADDVGAAMHWVGTCWAAALGDLGVATTVHRGALRHSEWSRAVCFAGLGPGEVVDAEGRKVVGVAQRRTRAGARFQTVAYHQGPIERIVELLDLGADGRRAAAELTATTAIAAVDPAALRSQLVANLPTLP